MTIEITLPIKCSTAKKAITSLTNITGTLVSCILLFLLPLGIIYTLLSVYGIVFIYGLEYKGILFVMLGVVATIVGWGIWYTKRPLKIKCIPDEVSPK